jgi:hypothetical protein
MMAIMNTAVIICRAIGIATAVIAGIIGTAVMAASNAAIMASIIICLLDDAGWSDVGRMDYAGKR